MSIKQISFSPELLDTPEIKPINIDDTSGGGCELTSNADLTQIDFISNQDSYQPTDLLATNPASIPMQMGGTQENYGVDLEAQQINFDSLPTQPAIRLSKQLGGNESENNVDNLS